MILELRDLFLGGKKSVSQQYELDLSKINFTGIYPFQRPIQVTTQIENQAGVIRLTADVVFDFFHPCDRCTKQVVKLCHYLFQHTLVTFLNDDLSDEYVLVENYQIDLDKLLREDILLRIPSKVLCDPSCKGLCPKCGKDLNEGECNCDFHSVDPRLEALRNLID